MIDLKKNKLKMGGYLSRRLHFPSEEKRLNWLSMLLDSYAIADTGVSIAIRNEEKRRKVKLACGRGCGNCCVHQRDIPLYPHELVGIYWYVSEKISSSTRETLKAQLAVHTVDAPCPFLVEGSCSIHPLRPVGCRQFNVFTTPCAQGEDPYYTRRMDVLVPIREYIDRTFAAVLPFYELTRNADLNAAVKLVRGQIMNLQAFNWSKLVTIIDNAESRK